MKSNFDEDLLVYLIDVEYLRNFFGKHAAAPILSKRIIAIHGVRGVGKSSLLRMLRLHCKDMHVPIALASGDEIKSALDVLMRWAGDLQADGIAFSSFGKTLAHYRAIQARVNQHAKMPQDTRGHVSNTARKSASKAAEAAGGALAGAAVGSVIPGVGTAVGGALVGFWSGLSAEALVDGLGRFLPKPDIDLLLDPTKKLSNDFLVDVARAANKQRIVLMLDTFEQMILLDDWMCDIAQRIHGNAILVIAGRALPNWSRSWQSCLVHTRVEELKPMTDDVMRDLVRRYYATMRGGEPNPVHIEAIIRFARGLPIVVASAVRLWVEYGVEDFQSVKLRVVADLVDQLMKGVPSELTPALEAAAVVRWFDQPILRAVTGLDDVCSAYYELQQFPFVRTRVEGLVVHDTVREIIDENLCMHDSERHRELHERAAAYFEKRLEKVTGEEAERLALERIYHCACADEDAGIEMFREEAEKLARFQLINKLRVLLKDVATYSLKYENSSLWHRYYDARLAHLEMRYDDAKKHSN